MSGRLWDASACLNLEFPVQETAHAKLYVMVQMMGDIP